MPKITVLPHPVLCPRQITFEAAIGENLLTCLLRQEILIEHACEMQCACATCHIYVRSGHRAINSPTLKEEEMLDRAWGVDLDSRLSCQVIIGNEDLTIEIPRYSANYGAD